MKKMIEECKRRESEDVSCNRCPYSDLCGLMQAKHGVVPFCIDDADMREAKKAFKRAMRQYEKASGK